MTVRVAALLLGVVLGVALAGGCRNGKVVGEGAGEPAPPYEAVESSYNERVERLSRLWARAVVSMRYRDVEGDRRYEQGDGHFQRLDGDKLALSVGKLGETLFWFGADEERYWLFDLTSEREVAYVGRHELLTREKAQRASLPVPPHQFLTLAGLSALPEKPAVAQTGRAKGGGVEVRVEEDGRFWRYVLDPVSMLPESVELLDASGEAVLVSELSEYATVDLTGEGYDEPRAPGRIRIAHPASETEILVTIDGDMIDGLRSGKPREMAFDFDVLVGALGPDDVIDLDESGAAVSDR